MAIVVGCAVVVLVVCIFAFAYYQLIIASESKNVAKVLNVEVNRLEALSYSELKALSEKEPRKLIRAGLTRVMRVIELKEIMGNLAQEIHVIVKVRGTRNPGLEEAKIISKIDKVIPKEE